MKKNLHATHFLSEIPRKTTENVELLRTFLHFAGTELVTFARVGICNRTSYYFVSLEQNLTSYIRNGTFDTTAQHRKLLLERYF